MPKFNVSVEKRMYCIGSIEVDAENEDQAEEAVKALINAGKLQTTEIKNWSDPEYEDFTFKTTGDVD